MTASAWEQLRDVLRENEVLLDEREQAHQLIGRIRQIAQDHVGCDCSAAVMILAVLHG